MLAGRGLVLRIPRARTSCARTRRRVGTTISASGKVIASRLSDIATRPPRLTDASAAAPLRAEPPARAARQSARPPSRAARAAMRPPACRPARARRGKDDAAAARAARRWPSTEKTKRARRLRPRAAISQAIRARRNPSPRAATVRRLGRWRPQRPAKPCGHEPPAPGGFGTGGGLGERGRRDEREHEGNGRFHWVDLCLGHYWETAGARH